ncbi:hypothetical protein J7I06_004452 [Vibrio vulnificus]|uniref:hypothetical protein n=1 Tax=Vibrio vulnificus TaxID=672 RepID=UPI000CCFEB25|nr:hypothetical protein [Vibrio vulnificus]EHH0804989.1 hypothetical protein [Vibrio vulnificus]EIV8483843.1 hypothetical protein [Vibrio vulnificus]POC19922.1 hypothetical protein CRN42_12135 [Vibrio vulnificus]
MNSNNYKGQVIKNALDCINYLFLSLVVYYFCFAPVQGNEFEVLTIYKNLNVWMWLEVLVFLGLLALSIVSASLVKVNIELFKVQKQIDYRNDNLSENKHINQTVLAVLLATVLCVIGYIGLGAYWGM